MKSLYQAIGFFAAIGFLVAILFLAAFVAGKAVAIAVKAYKTEVSP